jgi:hypothetical protein
MQFELKPTAVKKEQIDHINLLGRAVAALIDFAAGDDEALQKFLDGQAGQAASPATTGEAPAPNSGAIAAAFAIDKPVSNLIQMPGVADDSLKCKCQIAVKDKDSATHLCLLCNKNAYENHYVFAHTDDGKNLLAHKEEPIDKLYSPLSEEPFAFLAMPEAFAPASEEDHAEETD